MPFREGQLVRYTMDNLGCVRSDYLVNAGDTGIYASPAPQRDTVDEGWHITIVTPPGGFETLVCPVHESMFEAVD